MAARQVTWDNAETVSAEVVRKTCLVDACDPDCIVAHRANDSCHMGPMPMLIQHISAWRVCVEVRAVDVVDDACKASFQCEFEGSAVHCISLQYFDRDF